METFFKQVGGDFGDPFEYGGEWLEYRQQADGPALPTTGYMRITGNDASPNEGEFKDKCYVEYKHVSVSGNFKRRKSLRSEEWVQKWIDKFDRDYPAVQHLVDDSSPFSTIFAALEKEC